MTTTVMVAMNGADEILNRLGLEPGGKIQQYLAQRVLAHADKYTPMDAGVLKNTAMITSDGTAIIYDQPYARMMWYGKVMVDPVYNYAGLYNSKTGKWFSRKNVQKVVSPRTFNYRGAPVRGERWVERMWENEGESICRDLEKHLGG